MGGAEQEIADAIGALRTCLAAIGDEALGHCRAMTRLAAHLERVGPAWPVGLTGAVLPDDRRASMLAGPLFTSNEFPWPLRDGRWLEPVLQIDLAVLAQLKPLPVAEGWLQVWAEAAGKGANIRIVPPAQIARADLAPLPSLDAAAYWANRVGEPEEEGAIAWLPGHRIASFGEPFLDYGSNDLLSHLDAVREQGPDPFPPSISAALDRVRSALAAQVDGSPLVARAFGMVNESDVFACDLPPVLFVLEEGAPMLDSWNGADGAYVCIEPGGGIEPFSVRGPHL